MNFKDFKKVDVTKTHTVFKHPSGHTIEISHDSLSPEQKKQMREIPIQSAKERLREMKRMKDGGMIKVEQLPDTPIDELPSNVMRATPRPLTEEEKAPQQRQEQLMQKMSGLQMGAPKEYIPGEASGMASQPSPAPSRNVDLNRYLAPSQPQAPIEQTAMAPSAFEKEMEVTAKTAEEVKGIQEREAAQQANAYGSAMKQLQDLAVKSSQEKERLRGMMDQVNKSITENQIDPNRFMGNKGTLGRIGTALGLILGGIGQGMTGGRENLAMRALENAIDRDIDAQKQELGKKNNLLTAYYKMYGDLEQAEAATKAQIMSMTQLQANQIAARSKSQQAQQQNLLFQAQLNTKKEQYENQQAQVAADRELSKSTRAMGAQMPSEEQVYSYVDRRNLPDKAKADVKDAYTDYQAAMQGISDFKQIMSDQHLLSQLSSYKNPVQRLELLSTYKVALAPIVKAVTGETRMSDQEFKTFVEPLLSGPLTTKEALDKKIDIMIKSKMQDFKRYTTKLKGVGLDFPMPVVGEPIKTVK